MSAHADSVKNRKVVMKNCIMVLGADCVWLTELAFELPIDDTVLSTDHPPAGEEIWTRRVGGNYSGSPVCVDGKLYCVAQDGTVAVINAGPDYKLLGKTELGERCHSTPAIADGRLFIRGFEHLFCLKAQPTTLDNR